MFKEKGRKIEEKYSSKVKKLENEIIKTQQYLNALLIERQKLYKEIVDSNNTI